MSRQRYDELRAATRNAVSSDLPLVAFDYLSTNCQADTGAFILGPAVKPLKDRKDLVRVFFVKADAVVLDRYLESAVSVPQWAFFSFDLDEKRDVLSPEFQCVADEVLDQLTHLQRVRLEQRQVTCFDQRACLLDLYFQV